MTWAETTYTPTSATTKVSGGAGGGGGVRSSMDDLMERLIQQRIGRMGGQQKRTGLGSRMTRAGGASPANHAQEPARRTGAPMYVSYQGGPGGVPGALRGPYQPGQSVFAGYAPIGEEMPSGSSFVNGGRSPLEESGIQPETFDRFSAPGREMVELQREARAAALRNLYLNSGVQPPQGR